MFSYSVFGFSICSEISLPELPAGSGQPDVVIRYGTVPRTLKARATMHEEIAHLKLGGSFHIREGREIIVDPRPGVHPDLLRVLLIGRMMAFLLRQRGWLPLHASAVEMHERAVLFLGRSGSGKSTTAAAFYSRGHRVITDDVAAVQMIDGQCTLQPAGPRIRLMDDAREVFGDIAPDGIFQWEKHMFDLRCGEPPGRMPVSRIYLLRYSDQIAIEPMPALAAAASLGVHSLVKHERMDKESLEKHLRDCTLAARCVPVRWLNRSRSLSALPALVRAVESDLAI